MRAARDGLRWHLIEPCEGRYDWASLMPMLAAARAAGTQVIWDLCHYGLPSGLDIWTRSFIDRFAAFAGAAARVIASETDGPRCYTPVNEISFWSWAMGDAGWLIPGARGRSEELKLQLVRAALAATAAIRAVDPDAVIACAEPLIHVWPRTAVREHEAVASAMNERQFETLDMLLGRQAPELGGSEASVDLVGLNYYYNNQWVDQDRTVYPGDWLHRPLHHLLAEVAARYTKPLYISETGTEGVFRPYWLRYVADEVAQAIDLGVPVKGICLYPVLSHLGWDDDRHCHNGLFDGCGPEAERHAEPRFAAELAEQVNRFAARRATMRIAAE